MYSDKRYHLNQFWIYSDTLYKYLVFVIVAIVDINVDAILPLLVYIDNSEMYISLKRETYTLTT